MTGKNKALALLIATDEYADATFQQLRSPPADAEALAAVLADPAIGGYEVRALHNPDAQDARLAIEDLFADVGRNDLVLLYISGHGVKDDEGLLHFAMTNSRHNRLSSTAVDSQFVRNRMRFCRSRRIVVLLDCCYAGAFQVGTMHRAAESADVLAKLAGKGRAVLTSSSALEYSYEASDRTSASVAGTASPSVFTGSLVQGLRTGLADRNRDGLIDVDELYEYVHDQIKAAGTKQTPGLSSDVEGRLFVAISPVPPVKPEPKPEPGPATSDYRPEEAIPVTRLTAEVGQPWKRPRWGGMPRRRIVHLVRPTTPELLSDQLAAHLGPAVPYALVTALEPMIADGDALSGDLLDQLGRMVRGFVEHDAGALGQFRFRRYELLTQLLKLQKGWLLKHSHVDLAAAGEPGVRRWLLRQPYLTSSRPANLVAFTQHLLTAVHQRADEVHKLFVYAFLVDLAEGFRRQPLWARWARRDHYPVLLMRRLTVGTTGAEFVRLVIDVREETGTPDPLLIIATGTAVRHEFSRATVGVGDSSGTGHARKRRQGSSGYVPVFVSDQPRLASTDQPGRGGEVHAWTGQVQRPRVRSFFVRHPRVLRFVQGIEASFVVLLLLATLVALANVVQTSESASPSNGVTDWKGVIERNNDDARSKPKHIIMSYCFSTDEDLQRVAQVQEESLDAPIAIEVIVKERFVFGPSGNQSGC